MDSLRDESEQENGWIPGTSKEVERRSDEWVPMQDKDKKDSVEN